ncbi:MAG: hypothetical protein IJF88_02415 [Oscillospiraceae bacterium]|nr:hypothetical protein [Oscillospiraceae bacterium]
MKRTDITALFPEATKEQIDTLLDLAGADINAAKGDLENVRGQLATAQAEITSLKAKPADPDTAAQLQAVRDELAGLKAANALREIREKVSKELGVPASLLTGDNEDACKTQAEAIKAFADQKPAIPTSRTAARSTTIRARPAPGTASLTGCRPTIQPTTKY